MKTSPLVTVATAEATLIRSIDAATATIATIGTNAVDAALARLDAATSACHARLTHAMTHLHSTVAEIAETMEALAEGILEDLSTEEHLDRYGNAHRLASEPAPVPSTNSTSTPATSTIPVPIAAAEASEPAGDDDDGITLTEADFAHVRNGQSATPIDADAHSDALAAREATHAPHAPGEPFDGRIETPRGNDAAETVISVQAVAANSPVGPGRDDRKPAPSTATTPRRPRRKRS